MTARAVFKIVAISLFIALHVMGSIHIKDKFLKNINFVILK